MRHPSRAPSLEACMRAAWQAQLASAGQTPDLVPQLARRHELFPRFVASYSQLQALPRRVRRALQRQLGLPLATLALWLALGLLPVQAATIPVGGACTLVDAITAANTDTATGGCPAGSGADTLVLPAGSTQRLGRVDNTTYGPTGLPVVSSMITIEGQGSTITRDREAPEFRLLAVNHTGDLTLQETTVSGGGTPAHRDGGGVANYGGALTVLNSTISGNVAGELYYGGVGGGVLNVDGTLTLTNSTISGNRVYGILSGGYGGGVSNRGGMVTLTSSTISGNSAFLAHGGVDNSGTLTVRNSTITGNSAAYGSGGVSNSGTLAVRNSTITGNSGAFGGGLLNSGTCTVTNSTLAGNSASFFFGPAYGGGVDNRGTCTVTNSTIAGNSALGYGGGVSNYRGTLTVLNSTITGNVATEDILADSRGGGGWNSVYGILILARTLISGNTASSGPEVFNFREGTVRANTHNLLGVDGSAGVVGFTPGPTDVVPPAGVRLADILDPTLALHGGRTETHALVPGSPAIDAGGPRCLDADGEPLTADQRGKPRRVDGDGDGTAACDIGAVEFFPVVNDLVTLDPDVDTGGDPTPVPGGPAGTFTITATFTHTRETPLRFPFFEVTALSGGNVLLNAEGGPGGIGATRTPDVGDGVLSPGETMVVDFVIGLQAQAPFTFAVELFGEPRPAGGPSLSRVQVTRPR